MGLGYKVMVLQFKDSGLNDLPAQCDVNDLYVRDPSKFKKIFDKMIRKAKAFEIEDEEEEEESWSAKEFAQFAFELGLKTHFVPNESDPYYCSLPNDTIQIYPIKSSSVRMWLVGKAMEKEGRAISNSLMENIVSIFQGVCQMGEETPTELAKRFGASGSGSSMCLHINMGDRMNAVRVDKDGVAIVKEAPVKFSQSKLQMPQLLPNLEADISDIERVLKYTNFKTIHDEILFLTYLVGCMFPRYKRPMIILGGEFGSGKTTHLQIAKTLIDPSFNGQYHPRDGGLLLSSDAESVEGLIQHAQWAATLFLDNLSHLRIPVSDLLCSFITGGGTSVRALYTNNEQFPMIANPLVGINGITLVADRPDLLSRSIIFEVVKPKSYRTDGELWGEFNIDRPYILGAMYQLASMAIGVMDESKFEDVTRLGEYDTICRVVAGFMGYTDAQYMEAIAESDRRRKQGATEGSVVAQSIQVWFAKMVAWGENVKITEVGSMKFQITNESGGDSNGYGNRPEVVDVTYDRTTGTYYVTTFLEKFYKGLKHVADFELSALDTFPRSSIHLSRQLGSLKSSMEQTSGITWVTQSVQNRNKYTFSISRTDAVRMLDLYGRIKPEEVDQGSLIDQL
jgi:hypothetical protein